jgi:hypothetical protein
MASLEVLYYSPGFLVVLIEMVVEELVVEEVVGEEWVE